MGGHSHFLQDVWILGELTRELGKSGGVALGDVADEDKADAVGGQRCGAGEQGVPGAVEAQVAGVQKDKSKIAANRVDYLLVERWVGYGAGGDFGAVADYDESGRIDSLGQNTAAHVFAQDNHAGGAAQRPTVEVFPYAREPTLLDERDARDGARWGRRMVGRRARSRRAFQRGLRQRFAPFLPWQRCPAGNRDSEARRAREDCTGESEAAETRRRSGLRGPLAKFCALG